MNIIKSLLVALFLFLTTYSVKGESRIKVGMIDTGVSLSQATSDYLCKDGLKTAIDYDSWLDDNGHGTNVFGLIAKYINPKTHCIISYRYLGEGVTSSQSLDNLISSIYQARKDGVKYLNMSLSGLDSSSQEAKQIIKATEEGMTIIVASGNDKLNLNLSCSAFPACYKKLYKNLQGKLIVVGAYNVRAGNKGKVVDYYDNGYRVGKPLRTGTSQATAIITGKIISGKLKKRGIVN